MSSSRTRSSRATETASAVAAALVLASVLTACAGSTGTAPAGPPSVAGGSAAPTGSTETGRPVPGATSTPDPGSWTTAVAPAGFTIAVVSAMAPGADPEVDAAVEAIRARAGAATVGTATIPPGSSGSGDPFAEVLADSPDLIVVLGPELLDATDRSSASNLGQQFLIVGAQLPEPTANVTAVVWPGAAARRADEPRAVPNGMPEVAQRAGDALPAGLAALLEDTTGGVLVLP
jgi:hypothetical protein